MPSKKSVLIICESDLSREPRVIRQILALKDDYAISTLGAKASSFDEVIHYDFNSKYQKPAHWSYPMPVRKAYSAVLKSYEKLKDFYYDFYVEKEYWTQNKKDLVKNLGSKNFDLIIAHHWESLPLAHSLKKDNTKVIFNVHDYYSLQFEKSETWNKTQKRVINHVMDKYVPKSNLIFSAWTKIHDDYQKKYGIPSIIINNATEYNELEPKLKNDSDQKIYIVHHGIANSNRKIETMIKMMDYLDEKFHLDLMLIPSSHEMDYFNSLKAMADADPRINFIDTVPTREIPKRINQYDIGLYILQPNGFNLTYSLPNKVFEFVQARIACLVTPNIEMKTLVEQYDLGWVAEDFDPVNVANKIKNITNEELNQKKLNAHKNAHGLAAEVNYKIIKDAVAALLSSN